MSAHPSTPPPWRKDLRGFYTHHPPLYPELTSNPAWYFISHKLIDISLVSSSPSQELLTFTNDFQMPLHWWVPDYEKVFMGPGQNNNSDNKSHSNVDFLHKDKMIKSNPNWWPEGWIQTVPYFVGFQWLPSLTFMTGAETRSPQPRVLGKEHKVLFTFLFSPNRPASCWITTELGSKGWWGLVSPLIRNLFK